MITGSGQSQIEQFDVGFDWLAVGDVVREFVLACVTDIGGTCQDEGPHSRPRTNQYQSINLFDLGFFGTCFCLRFVQQTETAPTGRNMLFFARPAPHRGHS